MTGHLLVRRCNRAVATILAIRNNKVHPTINYETPDPDCDLNYIPNKAQDWNVDVAISNNLALADITPAFYLENSRRTVILPRVFGGAEGVVLNNVLRRLCCRLRLQWFSRFSRDEQFKFLVEKLPLQNLISLS